MNDRSRLRVERIVWPMLLCLSVAFEAWLWFVAPERLSSGWPYALAMAIVGGLSVIFVVDVWRRPD